MIPTAIVQSFRVKPSSLPVAEPAAWPGGKLAVVAVAHAILVIAYHLLADGGVYVDLGPNYFDRRAREKGQARLTRRLEALGFEVTVTERVEAAS